MIVIGIGSYEQPDALERASRQILANTVGEMQLFVTDNASLTPRVHNVLEELATDSRVVVQRNELNVGYAGAVNRVLAYADWIDAQYVTWCDQDCEVLTYGWNLEMERVLDECHEVAWIGAMNGFYEIPRARYVECQWATGCFWTYKTARYREVGGMDAAIGHQQECDLSLRLRLAGWKLAVAKAVLISHQAHQTNDPSAQQRIADGVISFVNKWCRYFCGPQVNYFSPNVLRWEDWPPNALYVEEYLQAVAPAMRELNREPKQRFVPELGRTVDLCLVPRWEHLYRGRLV